MKFIIDIAFGGEEEEEGSPISAQQLQLSTNVE